MTPAMQDSGFEGAVCGIKADAQARQTAAERVLAASGLRENEGK